MIRVRDHGPGIPEEVLPHVFDRFYKASASRPRSDGSGLGLSIAVENAHIHGGDISAANSPEGGAVFTLRLPMDGGAVEAEGDEDTGDDGGAHPRHRAGKAATGGDGQEDGTGGLAAPRGGGGGRAERLRHPGDRGADRLRPGALAGRLPAGGRRGRRAGGRGVHRARRAGVRGRLVDVDRVLPLRERHAGDPVRMARALLEEASRAPSEDEERAGFTTDVRKGLTVTGPGEGDPREALRLGTLPENLSVFALAQVVCTFSGSPAAASDGSVVLGGPDDAPLRRYSCTDEVRTRPGTAPTPAQTVAP